MMPPSLASGIALTSVCTSAIEHSLPNLPHRSNDVRRETAQAPPCPARSNDFSLRRKARDPPIWHSRAGEGQRQLRGAASIDVLEVFPYEIELDFAGLRQLDRFVIQS